MTQQNTGNTAHSRSQQPAYLNHFYLCSQMLGFQNVRKTSKVKKMRSPRIEKKATFIPVRKIYYEYQPQPSSFSTSSDGQNTLPRMLQGLTGSKTYVMGVVNSIAMHGDLIYNLLQTPERENHTKLQVAQVDKDSENDQVSRYFSKRVQAAQRNRMEFSSDDQISFLEEKRKCGCKRNRCLKSFCACHKAGEKCGIDCSCNGCQNN